MTVTNLPTNGSTLYVRLWSFVSVASSTLSVGWHFNDYTYTAFGTGSGGSGCSTPALATMSSPPPGTTLTGASVSFSWTAGCDVSQYYLYVGSALGTNDIYGQTKERARGDGDQSADERIDLIRAALVVRQCRFQQSEHGLAFQRLHLHGFRTGSSSRPPLSVTRSCGVRRALM